MSMDIRAKVKRCGVCTLPVHWYLWVNGTVVTNWHDLTQGEALDAARRFLSGEPPLATTP